ncbi:unnamed protein product, partial [Rodentolepis nana]|uniref:Transmembrane protein n=1 Tax=Rodentolepis nana TaxID=102285 RepID=A0A0R3T661_RODNA
DRLNSFKPTGEELIITAGYALFVLALIAPPNVLLSAGLTVEKVFQRFLGNEELFFTAYHLRRTTLLYYLFYCIPLGYFLSLRLFGNPEVGLLNTVGNYGVITSFALVIAAWTYIHLVWYSNGKWTGHPTMKELKKIARKIPSPSTFATSDEIEFLQNHRNPGGVVSSIDKEFRMMEKFVAFAGRGLTSSWSGRRIVVTPSWILYSHRTKFLPISQLLDRIQAVVVATRCINHQTLSADEDEERESSNPLLGSGVVMATIRIADMDSGVCLLSFDLPANEIESFRTHLRCQLAFAQGVSLEPSIIQRFLEVFTAVVHENDPIECPLSMELEKCIGCLITQTNVALRHSCGSSECGSCQCRPMWCVTCLGRWFASRLANARVPMSDWLGSRVPMSEIMAIVFRISMGSQQSILEGTSVGLPEIGLEDRHGSLVSLPGVSLPLSPGIRPTLSHSMTIRFRSDSAQKRRHRPVSCVIPDPGAAATPQSQIVVVSQGPRNLYRSSSTPKVFGSSGKWREDPQWEVYQLEHRVPKFEPLAKWKDLEGSDSTPLAEMVEIYKKHYSTAADIVLRKQDEILRLERKLEYESKQALESMQLRQRGGGFQTALQQNASPLPPPTSSPTMTITKAAGIYQLGRIARGIGEVNSRFKECEKLLNELKLQAEEIDRVLGSKGEKVDF